MSELINKLRTLGFTNYEAKVFLSLYRGYNMSAAEIAKDARIPRTSAYDILSSFAKKGYCNEIQTPTKLMYEIIDSGIIEDKLQIDIETEYKNKLTDLKNCFRHLRPHFKENQPPEFKVDVELLKGYNRHREQKLLELVRNSKKAILIMNSLKGYVNVSTELDTESKKFYRRGGVVRTIYENSTNFKIKINNKWQYVTHEGLIKLCESFTKNGEQVKLIREVPQFMAIFDEKIVYFSLADDSIRPQDMSDVIIKNRGFAKSITELFSLYWDKADTLEILKKQLKKLSN